MKASKKLQKVRQLLIDKGWCKGITKNGAGEHCVWGAINEVNKYSGNFEVAPLLQYVIDEDLVAIWNDAADDFSEILEGLDQATSLAMSEEAIEND